VLSTGAKAGIGLGAGVLAIAALAVLAWYVRGRNKFRRPRGEQIEIGDTACKNGANDVFAPSQISRSPDLMLGSDAQGRIDPHIAYEMGDGDFEMDGNGLGMERKMSELPENEKGARIKNVDDRVAAGYDGAYRGN
jgi:hypothetical protein